MARPLIALLTDFGDQDHYVGAMKGAILTHCADASLVDIVHDVPAHDVEAAAWALAAAFRAFPQGTVFVAVVDPGVGGARRALAVECGGHFFVGPDNGIFTYVLTENYEYRMRALTNQALMRSPISARFHARAVFGPVAAFLPRGASFDGGGPPARDPAPLRRQSMRP